ncbi:MAG: xylulokinase [Chloroflexi bacterium]|nr:xylulokinase [Chloroflexota bacterium]
MEYVLGLDISTTGAKAILVGNGKIIATHTTPQSVSSPFPLWSEQNPADWWTGTAESIRAVLAESGIDSAAIKAIGVTGQMHGLVMLDAAGRVLRPAILWNDQRTQKQCDEITRAVGAAEIIRITGSRVLTGFTAPKILWVRENEPEVYAQCAHILLPKDYIRYCLTGEHAIDVADASGTSLLDVGARKWSSHVTSALDIPTAWLPSVHEGTEITGTVHAQGAAQTGLVIGTPVVAGGGDQSTAAIGMGLTAPGLVSVTIGTSGVVFAPLESYVYEKNGSVHAFCHAVPGLWHWMGVMLSAAGALQWYRDTLAADVPFDVLVTEAASAPAGSDGLLFLPYLTGERTPHPDPLARGAFVGLTARHTRAHLTRSVLEGVAFGLNDSFTLMREGGVPLPDVARVAGGGARSPLWRQIIADVLGVPVEAAPTTEGSALGAAILAMVGAGWYGTVSAACEAFVGRGDITPTGTERAVYGEHYALYRELYPALKGIYQRLG